MNRPTEDTPTPDNQGVTPKHLQNLGNIYHQDDTIKSKVTGNPGEWYGKQPFHINAEDWVEAEPDDNLTPAQMKAASKIPKPDDNPFIGQDDKQLDVMELAANIVGNVILRPEKGNLSQLQITKDVAEAIAAWHTTAQIQLVSELEGSVKKIENPRLVDRGNEAYFPDTAEEFRIGYTLAMAQTAKILEHKKQELERLR